MDIHEIREEIKKLEECDATWSNVEKLSWLYIVNDHLSDAQAKEFERTINRMMP